MTKPDPWTRPKPWPFPIDTPRLTIRPAAHEDAKAVFDTIEASRASLLPWMPWAQYENLSLGQTHFTAEKFLREIDAAEAVNIAVLILDRHTGAPMGGTGLHGFVAGSHQAEVGYWVSQEHRGKGICTEAVVGLTKAALGDLALSGMGLRRLEIVCSADNQASARVAIKAGYQHEATLRQHRWVDTIGWSDTLIFAALADSWSAP